MLVFLAIPLSCHIISSILQSPLCLTLSITLGNKKLFSARVTVKASVYTKKLSFDSILQKYNKLNLLPTLDCLRVRATDYQHRT